MSRLRRRRDELRLAMMLTTRVPMGTIASPAPTLASAAWAFPLCGVPVALMCGAVWALAAWLGLSATLAAAMAVAAAVAMTGALHEDGLADLADGFGGGIDRARKLEIMRDSRLGSYGAIALLLVVLIKVLAMAQVGAAGSASQWIMLAGFLALAVGSRWAMLILLGCLPPAREDGMGRSAGVNGVTPLLAGSVTAALCLVPMTMLAPGAAMAAAVTMVVATACVARLAMAQIGGQTGDVLGAGQSLSEAAGWVALAAAITP